MFEIKSGLEYLRQALCALDRAAKAIRQAKEKRDELQKIAAHKGLSSENVWLSRQLADVEDTEKAGVKSAIQGFEKHATEYRNAVAKAAYPSGANITGESAKADIWILEKGYITEAQELAEMRMRYASPMNPAMLRIIEKYANERFADTDREAFAFQTDVNRHMTAHKRLMDLAAEVLEDADDVSSLLPCFIDGIDGKADAEGFIAWANDNNND